jgi:adenosylcobinamide-phosphate synthase
VAPFFYFAIFGVPGALAYRAINTLDAMIGYHGEYEYLGKAAAILDDWANLIPARLTAGLLVLASLLAGADSRAALWTAVAQHAYTESPNSGWPMAAMAGALGVRLEKIGHYSLGHGNLPEPPAIRRAVRIADKTVAIAAIALFAALAR